jgi:hypothetical protein
MDIEFRRNLVRSGHFFTTYLSNFDERQASIQPAARIPHGLYHLMEGTNN